MTTEDRGVLCVGDEFALKMLPNDEGATGFVSADPAGMRVGLEVLFEDGDGNMVHPARPLFSRLVLHTPNQYSAAKQLRKRDRDRDNARETNADNLNKQAEAEKAEAVINENEYKLAIGQKAIYGGTYQFLSPLCDRFISMANEPADTMKTAIKCGMETDQARTRQPWFNIQPGYRTRKEGERVRMGDVVVLRSVKRPGAYLHAKIRVGESESEGHTERNANQKAGTIEEVNLFGEATRFQVVPVAKHWMRGSESESTVRAGSYVMMFMRQSETYIYRDHELLTSESKPSNAQQAALLRPRSRNDIADSEHVAEVVLRADLLWQVNRPTMVWSGASLNHDPRGAATEYSLRDAVTGGYLAEQGKHVIFVADDNDMHSHWYLRVSHQDQSETTFVEEFTGFYIENRASGRKLAIGDWQAPENGNNPNGDMFDLECKDTVDEEDVFVFRTLPADWLQNFAGVLPKVNRLREFHRAVVGTKLINAPPNSGSGAQATDAVAKRQRLESEPDLLGLHEQFLFPASVTGSEFSGPFFEICEALLLQLTSSPEKDVLKRDGKVNVELQNHLTSVQLPNFLLDELLPALFKLASEKEIADELYGPHLLQAVKYIYRLLCILSKEHHGNSKLLFRRMGLGEEAPIVVKQLNYGFGVADCLTEIITNMPELMVEVKDELVTKIWNLARSQRLSRYLDFLCMLVYTKPRPVKFNQDRVSKIIQNNMEPKLYDVPLDDEEKMKHDEVEFHVELIRLTALLCMGRHRQSIDFFLTDLSVGLTYERVLSYSVGHELHVLDNRIPWPVRHAYTMLMRSLFIDREPAEYCAALQTCRIMPPLGKDVAEIERRFHDQHLERVIVDPYHGIESVTKPTEGFADLKAGIIHVLESVDKIRVAHTDENLFLTELVQLVHEMLQFNMLDKNPLPAYFHDGVMTLGDVGMLEPINPMASNSEAYKMTPESEAISVGRALLNVLNGADDDMSDVDLSAFGVRDVDEDIVRFDTRLVETTAVLNLRKTVLPVIMSLFELRESTKIQMLLNYVTEASEKQTPAASAPLDGSQTKTTAYSQSAKIHQNPLVESEMFETEMASNHLGARADHSTDAAQKAMEQASFIRVYNPDEDKTLTSSLLDMMRYKDDFDACLGAFNALVFLKSQHLIFAQKLQQVTILGTTEQAAGYLSARADVSEFRRLRKWLHDPAECDKCTDMAGKIIKCWCRDHDGQDLLRTLNLQQYLLRILRMKRTDMPESFTKLQKQCVRLVAAFCSKNVQNQNLFAVHMNDVLLPLLHDPGYFREAAEMITAIVVENAPLSVAYSGVLMQEVVDASKQHGRCLHFLLLLQRLLVVGDVPVETSQVQICKAAFHPLARQYLLDVDCNLEDERCEPEQIGPKLTRIEVIRQAAANDGSQACERCRNAVACYAKSLEILGLCSKGTMPATETLCASILSFDECITRLNEVYSLQDGEGSSNFFAELRAELLTFLVDVFIDTNTDHVLIQSTLAFNGLWKARNGTQETPVTKRLLQELRERVNQFKAESSAPATEVVHSFEVVCLFFISFACCIGPGMASKDEQSAIDECFKEVRQLAGEALTLSGWSQREEALIQQLQKVAQGYINNSVALLQPDLVADTLAKLSRMDEQSSTPCLNSVAWNSFVAEAVSTMNKVRGTRRLVGPGIISLAKALWMMQEEQQVRYASFLVEPLKSHLPILKAKLMRGVRDDIPKVLTVLEAARAIPYFATPAYSEEKKDSLFQDYVQVQHLNHESNPYLAGVQKEMVSQGWALLCLEIISIDELKDLRLEALQLLLAITNGGNEDVQNELVKQLQDISTCPREILASSCRKLLRNAIVDLKAERKVALLREASEASEASKASAGGKTNIGEEQEAEQLVATGYAVETSRFMQYDMCVETLRFMANCCKGQHAGMQDYIREQPGHHERYDLISDVINYVTHLERDIKADIRNSALRAGENETPLESDVGEGDNSDNFEEHYVSDSVQRFYESFHLLQYLARGPNFESQTAIATSDLIPVMNRILAYSHYDTKQDVDSKERILRSAKGQVHAQITKLLLTLLEGVPRPDIVKRILGALDWETFGHHLTILQNMMSKGVVCMSIDADTSARTQESDGSTSPTSADALSSKDHVLGQFTSRKEEKVPEYVADPDNKVYADWLSKEAFQFFTIVETVRIAGEQLERSGDWSYKNCLDPLRPLLADVEMMNFFKERIGQVEVVRADNIERLFFWRPHNTFVGSDSQFVEKQATDVVDNAPRDESVAKLQHFIDGAFEIVAMLDSQDRVGKQFGSRVGKFIAYFFAWFDRTNPTMGLSLLICINLMISYYRCEGDGWSIKNTASETLDIITSSLDPAHEEESGLDDSNGTCLSDGSSFNRATFSRSSEWPILGREVGFEAFLFLGCLHVLLSVMRFLSFLLIRVPVLEELHKRSDRLEFFRGLHSFSEKERNDFIGASVLVYGLPYKVPDDNIAAIVSAAWTHKPSYRVLDEQYVRDLFPIITYGDIGAVRVVPVKQAPNAKTGEYSGPKNNSWALLKFENAENAKKLTGSVSEGQQLRVRASVRPDAQEEHVSVVSLTPAEVSRSTTLSEAVRAAEVEYNLLRKDALATATIKMQNIASSLKLGWLPISAVFTFKSDPEVYGSLIDMAGSILGMVYSPLCFSFHLFRIAKFPGASIVVQSMTHNVTRLAVALLLCLLFAWIFAISGMLVFPELHDEESVDNPGGPCKNLLTCFFSYSYAGLTLTGLEPFLPEKVFPIDAQGVFGHHVAKTVWEVTFLVLSTLIGSIITGIICDTFSELRVAQVDAAAYRTTTNFITGITFSKMGTEGNDPSQQSTHYIQYTWLLLYLRQKTTGDLSPLEALVEERIRNGDASWLPDGRSTLLEDKATSAETGMELLHVALRNIQEQQDQLQRDVRSLRKEVSQRPSVD